MEKNLENCRSRRVERTVCMKTDLILPLVKLDRERNKRREGLVRRMTKALEPEITGVNVLFLQLDLGKVQWKLGVVRNYV